MPLFINLCSNLHIFVNYSTDVRGWACPIGYASANQAPASSTHDSVMQNLHGDTRTKHLSLIACTVHFYVLRSMLHNVYIILRSFEADWVNI